MKQNLVLIIHIEFKKQESCFVFLLIQGWFFDAFLVLFSEFQNVLLPPKPVEKFSELHMCVGLAVIHKTKR